MNTCDQVWPSHHVSSSQPWPGRAPCDDSQAAVDEDPQIAKSLTNTADHRARSAMMAPQWHPLRPWWFSAAVVMAESREMISEVAPESGLPHNEEPQIPKLKKREKIYLKTS